MGGPAAILDGGDEALGELIFSFEWALGMANLIRVKPKFSPPWSARAMAPPPLKLHQSIHISLPLYFGC